jgi:DNA-directed RNA polymerase alpha subunit
MKKLDHISIDFLNLSKRTYHALVRSRVLTIGDLNKRIINGDLIQIQFVGEKSLDEISKALRELYKNPPKVIEKEKTKDNLVSIGNTNVNMLDQIPLEN